MRRRKNYDDIFDSDDELPYDYKDVYVLPAYQNECRFETINFKWIHKPKKTINTQPLLKRGVMNEQDMYCLKSIQGIVGNSTLIWLLNFFLHKDLQSEYAFPRSCLVSSIV